MFSHFSPQLEFWLTRSEYSMMGEHDTIRGFESLGTISPNSPTPSTIQTAKNGQDP
jgi:hypothetical protein